MNQSDEELLPFNKVALLLGWFQLGGAERQAFLLARELYARGVAVEMWAFESDGTRAGDDVTTLCDAAGIAWRTLPRPMGKSSLVANLLSLWRVFWAMRNARADVILGYTLLPNVIVGLMWRACNARAFLWGQRSGDYEFVGHRLERIAVSRTRVFTSNSHHAAQFLQQSYGVAADAVHVIPNGLYLKAPLRTRYAWRGELQSSETRVITSMVAHLCGYKDHAMLVRAWARVVNWERANGRAEDEMPLLVLAGRFEDATDEVRQLIDSFHLGRYVKLLGAVEDVTGLLEASDLCAFCSQVEGVPNGVLEAMACGLAVVGSDIPGVREAVGEENAAFLAPSGDDEALSHLLLRFLNDASLRQKVGQANRRRTATSHSPSALCERYLALINAELSARN